MHHPDKIKGTLDDIAPITPYLVIGVLMNLFTREEAISCARTHEDDFARQLEAIQKVAKMYVENAQEIDAIFNGNAP